jgi:hypothetical protein
MQLRWDVFRGAQEYRQDQQQIARDDKQRDIPTTKSKANTGIRSTALLTKCVSNFAQDDDPSIWVPQFCIQSHTGGRGERSCCARCPPYHPTSKLVGTRLSDNETVAKTGHPDLWRAPTLEPFYFVAASRTSAERLRASARVASWVCARAASGTSMASLTPGMTTAA